MPDAPIEIIELEEKKEFKPEKAPLTYRQQLARDKLAENAAKGIELPKLATPSYRSSYPDKKK